jgi:hypothetical protein
VLPNSVHSTVTLPASSTPTLIGVEIEPSVGIVSGRPKAPPGGRTATLTACGPSSHTSAAYPAALTASVGSGSSSVRSSGCGASRAPNGPLAADSRKSVVSRPATS